VIELKDISKKFNLITALNQVSFKIKRGEIVGLLGPNGAGKTTTLRIIAGIFPPTSGQVLIDNKDLNKKPAGLKKNIGYLPENNPLYEDLTVEEFLRFWGQIKGLGGSKLKKAVDFVVEETNISSVYYRPIAELSKGFRQRVGLSQAILTKPKILLLDEPTEGLDPNQRQEIKKLIVSLGKQRTVIIASHVLSEISQIAQRMIIINKGRLVADDSVANLRQLKKGIVALEVEIKGRGVLTELRKLAGATKVKKLAVNRFLIESKKDLRENIFNLAKRKSFILLEMFKKQAKLEDVFSQLTHE